MKRFLRKYIIIFLFIMIIMFPYKHSLYGNGLAQSDSDVKLEFGNLDENIFKKFYGRYDIAKQKNYFLNLMFGITSNDEVTKIGDTLFSTEELDYWLYDLHSVNNEEILKLVNKINIIKNLCKEKNKKMLIILTPTKLRYYDGKYMDIDYYILNKNGKSINLQNKIRPYDVLKKEIVNNNIDYFDCAEYINNNKDLLVGGIVPLFYKNGHHFSNYKGNLIGLGLHKYVRDRFNIKIPKLSIKALPSDVAISPDSDLFDSLNLSEKPNEKFYSSEVTFDNFDTDNLNFVVCGGSFLCNLLIPHMTISEKGSVVEIVNNKIFLNNYKKVENFDTLDEANVKYDLISSLKNADMFILEINELNVYNATFGFLDFLIEHENDI